MKWLVAVYDKGATDVVAEADAPPPPSCIKGEPVIIGFHDMTQFLGCQSFLTCATAQVKEGADPDAILEALIKRYRGIPERMIKLFVMQTCMAAAKMTEGTKVSIMQEDGNYRLWDIALSKHGPVVIPSDFKTEAYL
jgi:hypothetical protein